MGQGRRGGAGSADDDGDDADEQQHDSMSPGEAEISNRKCKLGQRCCDAPPPLGRLGAAPFQRCASAPHLLSPGEAEIAGWRLSREDAGSMTPLSPGVAETVEAGCDDPKPLSPGAAAIAVTGDGGTLEHNGTSSRHAPLSPGEASNDDAVPGVGGWPGNAPPVAILLECDETVERSGIGVLSDSQVDVLNEADVHDEGEASSSWRAKPGAVTRKLENENNSTMKIADGFNGNVHQSLYHDVEHLQPMRVDDMTSVRGEHLLDVGGTTGSCLLSPTGGGDPGAELCVGRVANAPANTPVAAHQCMSPELALDVQLNLSTVQVAASRGKRKLMCMTQAGDEVLGKNFRSHLKQPLRSAIPRVSAVSEQRAVESLLARGVRK